MASSYSPKTYVLTFTLGAVLAAAGLFAFTQLNSEQAVPAGDELSGEQVVSSTADLPAVTVYKSPACGCCAKWIDHLEAAGFPVEAADVNDLNAVKARYGVPEAMASCHTAIVDGYVVEGHVPAGDVKRLLSERPDVTGLAVPGMPIGSPGMEQGDRRDPYATYAFRTRGEASVFEQHNQ